mgnify:CR=1 FL=1
MNCALLNTGDGAFIDASNSMGLGLPDDSRNFLAVDWDGDGDLDLWLKNRTAPMVRFLRNDGAQGQSLRLKLKNTGPNGAAIGARVEVRAGDRLLVREHRAGTGFLTQGSAWLHFGLGAASAIDSVQVRWPDGTLEQFKGCQAGERYLLQRGQADAELLPRDSRKSDLRPSKVVLPKTKDMARVALTRHLPAPTFEVNGFNGEALPARNPGAEGRPLLLTFWASWCSNCLGEMREWSKHAQELANLEVSVLALSVDENPLEAQAMWERLGLPFDAGMAPKRTVVLFDMLQRLAIDRQRDMAVPTSFLFDADGRIAVIYRGPVEFARLQADLKLLDEPALEYAGAPFPGRSFQSAGGLRLFDVARRLLDVEAAQDALYYLNSAEADLRDRSGIHKPGDQSSLADALMRAGMSFMQSGALDLAEETMQRATKWAGSEDAIIWFASAKLHSVRGEHGRALRDVEKSIELDGEFAMSWNMLGSLKLMNGDLPGCISAQKKAVSLDPGLASAWSELGIGLVSNGQPAEAHAAFKKALELAPDVPNSWTGLGMCLLQLGQRPAGLDALRKALELEPNNGRALEIMQVLGER